MSVIVTAKSQTPTLPTVSSSTDFPELAGDQVITRAYRGQYKITHFRHKDDAYKHSFLIQGGFPFITKRIQFNINLSILSDTLYRLNVNDMSRYRLLMVVVMLLSMTKHFLMDE